MSNMGCGLCRRQCSGKRKPLCVSCVQASLYKPRLDQVRALLSREKSHAHVEAVVRPGNDGILAALPEDADWDAITASISTEGLERTKVEKETIELRISDIMDKAKELQHKTAEHKRYITEHKQMYQQRRQAIIVERAELQKRRARALEPVHAAIKKANRYLDKAQLRTAEAKAYLCKEVGALCGLQRAKDKKGRSEYYLEGLPIPNLKDLNCINGRVRGDRLGSVSGQRLTEPHELISASLDGVCLFLGICCHYLSVRLPAEIVLSHGDFPHTALMQRDSSYRVGEPRYPGAASRSSSPAASRVLSGTGERGKPRLLQLDRPLVHLHKQDHKTYGLFVEGVMLLAYDIAWLCRAQGIIDGTPSFDDVCDIGRNLYMLASNNSKASRPSLDRRATGTTNRTQTDADSMPLFGRYSHGSSRHSLAGHEGFAMFAPDMWKVSVTTLTDKLKSYLRNEAARSEWHIVEDIEWDDVPEHEKAVMVGGALTRQLADTRGPTMSVMSVAPHDGTDDSDAKQTTNISKGNNGWMKVRGRE